MIGVPPHHLLDLDVQALGLVVLLTLALHTDIVIEVVREDVNICIL